MRGPAKHLTKGVAIYGAGDAAINIVNFVLLFVYVQGGFVSPTDYGAVLIIGALETFAKVLSRWGLDGAFMRLFHDREAGAARQKLASSMLWFMLAANSLIFGAALASSGSLSTRLFSLPGYLTPLRLMLINTFLISFTFVPFHAMRLRNEPLKYSAFAFARSIGTLVLRIVLVIVMGLHITGFYLADLIMTLVLLPWLWPWFRPFVGAVFSRAELAAALRFGFPRVPHGLAQQALDSGNKLLLSRFIPLELSGVYQNDVSVGTTGIKFFTSAFETAWAPFYYATAKQPDAKEVFRKMTTYGVAVLALLVAGTTAIAHDIVLVALTPQYLLAWRVIPIVALAVAFQGVYLLTSIGLNLTSRTIFYPVATFAAAGVGLGSGWFLMPKMGVVGAAIAFLLSCVTQAIIAFVLSQRFYPVTYEAGRLVRILSAALVSCAAALALTPAMSPLAGLLARGSLTVIFYVALLWVTGFFRPTERAFMREMIARVRRRGASPPSADAI